MPVQIITLQVADATIKLCLSANPNIDMFTTDLHVGYSLVNTFASRL